MLTKQDKKFITTTVTGAIVENNKILIKEMTGLFEVTNERIDKTNENIDKVNNNLSPKIDQISKELKYNHNILDTHERRIEKVEEKVFTTTSA